MRLTPMPVLLLAGLLAACGSTAPDVVAPTTIDRDSTTSAPSTTVVMAGAVTTISGLTADAEPLRSGAELSESVRYSSPDFYAPLFGLSFVSPIDGAVADLSSVLYVARDASLQTSLLYVANIDGAGVYADPLIDVSTVASQQQLLDALAGRMPDDFLGWFTGLPGLTFGPIETTEVAGFPARSVHYDASDLPDAGASCSPTPCLAGYVEGTFSGIAYLVVEGESGTAYEVNVLGARLHIDVPDDPDSRAAFESLRFEAIDIGTSGPMLPQWGPVEPDTVYVGRTLRGVEYTVGPLDVATSAARLGSATTFSFPAADLPGAGDAAVLDPEIVMLREDPAQRPIGFGGDGDPGPSSRPADLIAGLASHPGVEVIEPERTATRNGTTIRSIEVRALANEWVFGCADDAVALCSWILEPRALYLRTDRTTRVTVIEDARGEVVLVTMAHIDTPGDALVATVAITPAT